MQKINNVTKVITNLNNKHKDNLLYKIDPYNQSTIKWHEIKTKELLSAISNPEKVKFKQYIDSNYVLLSVFILEEDLSEEDRNIIRSLK